MSPHLDRQPESNQLTAHLTEDQFGKLLTRAAEDGNGERTAVFSAAESHLEICAQCSAELAAMRNSLSLFRQATRAYADNELRSVPRVVVPVRSRFSLTAQPVWLAAAAAALLLAAVLPLQLARQQTRHHPAAPVAAAKAAPATQSDEALLEDIDRDTSASVPASMQALADPTANGYSNALSTSSQTSTQRKD